jgi:molybdopterin/thiamine biosynthesis adenylyltransferase
MSTSRDLAARLRAAATSALGPDGQECRIVSLAAVQRIAQQTGVSRREVEVAALREHVLPARYGRSLGTVGWEGQIKLLESTVAVVGAGGLGGWIIEGLARMGVGRLIVIDGDVFVENNLNRQALCTEETLGRAKAEVAAERVAAVNAAVEVTVHARLATAENMPPLLQGAQVVVDALDSLPTRLLLQDACRALGVPLVHGAIAGYLGQVTTIFPGDAGLRALYGDVVPEQGIERQLGNPAGTPLMVAAWQVQETIKLLLGSGEPLRSRLLLLDAEAGTAEIVKLG